MNVGSLGLVTMSGFTFHALMRLTQTKFRENCEKNLERNSIVSLDHFGRSPKSPQLARRTSGSVVIDPVG
jgi:hypothetical protein